MRCSLLCVRDWVGWVMLQTIASRPFRKLPARVGAVRSSAAVASFTLKGVLQSEAFMDIRCSVAVSMLLFTVVALHEKCVFSGSMGIPIVCATFVLIPYNFCAVHYFLYHFIFIYHLCAPTVSMLPSLIKSHGVLLLP
jgi:hypothetical protein